MQTLQFLMGGFQTAASPENLLYCLAGVLVGVLVGILPGLGPSATIAILLPLTFTLEPTAAIIMLAGIYYGSMYGGSITSILVNMPGEAASVATTFDGYPLARKGQAGRALGLAITSSFVGGTFSVLALAAFAPVLAQFALSFGPPEYFAVMLLALVCLTMLTARSVVKALLMGATGLTLALVGQDVMLGSPRFTFGSVELLSGFDFVVVAMGLFALGEILSQVRSGQYAVSSGGQATGRTLPTLSDLLQTRMTMIRGSVIGFIVGVLPGAGATVASFFAYATERRVARSKELFGEGDIRGVAAPEAANNAATGGAMVPLLTLGVPGSAVTAILLGALTLYGLEPGPLLFTSNPEFVWAVIASMFIGNALLIFSNFPLIPVFVQILRVDYRLVYPVILVLVIVGVYAVTTSYTQIWFMLAFGLLGLLMNMYQYPMPPLIVGLVIGPMFERTLRQSLIISDGSAAIFVQRPISLTIIFGTTLVLVVPFLVRFLRRLRVGKSLDSPTASQPGASGHTGSGAAVHEAGIPDLENSDSSQPVLPSSND